MHGTQHSATTSPSSSRAVSRTTSLYDASSGYESTRSHLGPHYSSHNMPRNNSPEPKYNTLKPRRRKQQQHKHTQFYSLRVCRKHDKTRRSYQLYAIPIIKQCQHKINSTSTIDTEMPDNTSTSGETQCAMSVDNVMSIVPPIPAPRTIKTDPTKHTYQNVPSPIYPGNVKKIKKNSLTDTINLPR